MDQPVKAMTIGELRASGYRPVSVKEEMRRNLIRMLRQKDNILPGIIGYDETVVPQIEHAIISGQDIIFLGERGQAKSRIMRSLVNLLDDEIPVIAGCEINDNPFAPICRSCRDKVSQSGNEVAIAWLPREARYAEKLATPDTTIADLIGDVDPIKVTEGRYLSDELTIYYGLIPRTNRGIFSINELPELMERLQVGLFNLMEERDVQIRGYRISLPLDIFLVASANPEDYTSRGRIITPLKDRYGAQIRTHYPSSISDEITIMDMERRQFSEDGFKTYIPQYMKEIIAAITQLARKSPEINQRSGVSVRMSIANYETVLSSAIRRAVVLGEELAIPRISDLLHIRASTLGKLEMEGFEEVKEDKILAELTGQAVKNVFSAWYRLEDLKDVIEQFIGDVYIETSDTMSSASYISGLKKVPGLSPAIKKLGLPDRPEAIASAVEFVLEGLYLNQKLNKTVQEGRAVYGC
jgi:magnesium chelatase subunit I